MNPLHNIKLSHDLSADNEQIPSESAETPAMAVLQNREMFATICLHADPLNSISLSCLNKKTYTSTAQSFNPLEKIFSISLTIKNQGINSLSSFFKQQQIEFNSICKKLSVLTEKRGIAGAEDVSLLCWRNLPLLKGWDRASNKLIVWEKLAEILNSKGPCRANLSTIMGCIKEAEKFSQWSKDNKTQLAQLQELDLSCTCLTVLPASIGQLTGLQWLGLAGNNLTELPSEIGHLAALQQLDLSINQLTVLPASLGQLTQLQSLSLSSNQLDKLPTEIGQLTGLQELDINSNLLIELPASTCQLTGLEQLHIASNQLSELPPLIGQLTQLQSLSASSNQLAKLPTEIGQLTGLRELDLSSNHLVELPSSTCQLTGLEQLFIDNNQLAYLPLSIGQLTALQWLTLGKNQFSHLPTLVDQLMSNGCDVNY